MKINKLTYYWASRWQCTDSWVGIRLYFYEGEFVAVSSQSARKSHENFDWKDKESYFKSF